MDSFGQADLFCPDTTPCLIQGIDFHNSGIPESGFPFLHGQWARRRWKDNDPPFSAPPGEDHRKGTPWDGYQEPRFWVEYRQ